MTLVEILEDYFKSTYRKYPNLIFTFPQEVKNIKNLTAEVSGMYFTDVVINHNFILPCLVYFRAENSVMVLTDHKRTKDLKKYLKTGRVTE